MRDHRSPDLDLGDDHRLWFTSWAPDRDLNPQYADLPDTDRIGAIIGHPKPDGTPCAGSGIMFDSEVARRVFGERSLWAVESWEPLTISPSLLCVCGDHGFIKQGRWVPA